MYALISLINSTTPRITNFGWDKQSAKGWRWERNVLYRDIESAKDVFRTYQHRYGSDCVAIGQAFDDEAMRPSHAHLSDTCGLYVLDVEPLIEELRDSLNNENLLMEWLS
jgi:hypothetical protein